MRNTAVSPHAGNLALLVGTPDLPEAVGDVAADDTANGFALRSVTSSVWEDLSDYLPRQELLKLQHTPG